MLKLNRCRRQLRRFDCVVVGAGHNGLVAAAYLAKGGRSVCVLESRDVVGGAAVTEELLPGFRYSRASYVLSLLRPRVARDLQLKERHGLRVIRRDPSSYTPIVDSDRSLILCENRSRTDRSIGQFAPADARNFWQYERLMRRLAEGVEPLLDETPPLLTRLLDKDAGLADKLAQARRCLPLCRTVLRLRADTTHLLRLLTAPASDILDEWFQGDALKATLATDSVIGAMTSPTQAGSGYVLLHHVMGELDGVKGAWGFVRGGMGGVSEAIAECARERGVEIFTNSAVKRVNVNNGRVQGVTLANGDQIDSNVVLSNATPKVTFEQLVEAGELPRDFLDEVGRLNYDSPVTKINVAVSRLPNFLANPNAGDGSAPDHFHGTIHLNSENCQLIEQAYQACRAGGYSDRPVIEMTVPSVLDDSLAPKGAHVVQLFTQYTPKLLNGKEWTEADKEKYKNVVFDSVERYAPGFRDSVLHVDLLTPQDLERVFGLTGGNIFHGSMSLHQLYFQRPTPSFSDFRSPVRGLYLCGSGAHPGGGVMGSAGRLCANEVEADWRKGLLKVRN